MLESPAITGLGLVTPLGHTVEGTWTALVRGDFITNHSKITLPDATPSPRVIQLARLAASEAVRNAGWTADQLASLSTALVVGTSKGPIESWLEAPHGYAGLGCGLSEVAYSLATELGIGSGPRLTLSAACASGLHALIRAAMLIRSGECDRALVVAAEASVHPLFLGSFRRLGVLAPEGFGCRPFDLHRAGFLMSDAAAAVCLESANVSRAIAVVDACAMGSDATHITGGDPSGKVLRRLLGGVVGETSVDLMHAHGTGTVANDAIELDAIESVFSGSATAPALYSHKGALGHSLGAAGLVSIVLNCLAMCDGIVPPNVRLATPMPVRKVRLNSGAVLSPIRRCVSIAAGFGGPIAVVSLAAPQDIPSQRSASSAS